MKIGSGRVQAGDRLPAPRASPRGTIVAALAQRVSSGLHLGILRYGEKLPSARAAAREFAVDPRVALAAYRELETRGVVELRSRSGVYVALPPAEDHLDTSTRGGWLLDILAEGITQGIPASELAERVRQSLATVRLRATVLECNDDQLFSVSTELEHDYGLDVISVDIGSPGEPLPPDARRADCVVTTRPHAEHAREVAESLGVPALVLSMCDDLFSEVRQLLPSGPMYFVTSDVRFEAKLRRIFEADAGAQNLRIMVLGRDDVSRIPLDAPAYLTRLTRKKLGKLPLFDRVIPEASVFSESSSREVLDFIIRANLAARSDRYRSAV
ncbi:MAG: GntR family transcriptional regulator [Gemmatimonadaceae bacterium]|nr:GntR family transcriptional regulator [Gemmatimonadaceae bacterium]